MSPSSRGRKKKSSKKRGDRHLAAVPDEPQVSADAQLNDMFRSIVRTFRKLGAAPDPIEPEIFLSGLQGQWWGQLPLGENPDAVFGGGLIDYAASHPSREALATLRAFAACAVVDEQRARAAAAADDLAGSLPEPTWADAVGRVTVDECWRAADAFGESSAVCVTFGPIRHAVLLLIDSIEGDGFVQDIMMTDEPEQLLSEFRASTEPGLALEPIGPADARRIIEAGIAATDSIWQPDLGESLRQFRALALARARVLPNTAPSLPATEEWDPDEREAVVTDFVASGKYGESAEYCARLFVDYLCDYTGGGPLGVGPGRVETFLLHWLPRKAILDDADRDSMPAIVAAFVRYAAERRGLPADVIETVVAAAQECGNDFAGNYDKPENSAVARDFLRGVELAGADDVERVMERRSFAMPYFGTRIGDDDYPRLDPGDPDERRILIEGEHPEYHDVLRDPEFDGELDGVNPRLHIATHEIVANQLWDNDPPQVWEAAKRLLDTGMDRHDVLHEIGAVVMREIWQTLHDGAANPEVYIRALDNLGRSERSGQTYRVRIDLLGVKPPIWRRLRLPATLTLDALHSVIQVAFGWEDSHLHVFTAGRRRYGTNIEEAGDETGVRLCDVVRSKGSKLRYTYDFGDHWEHELVVEEVVDKPVGRVSCVAGRRAAPPEDCGGIWGYEELCAAMADTTHPRRAELIEWFGGEYDPAAFDRAGVNDVLGEFAAVRR